MGHADAGGGNSRTGGETWWTASARRRGWGVVGRAMEAGVTTSFDAHASPAMFQLHASMCIHRFFFPLQKCKRFGWMELVSSLCSFYWKVGLISKRQITPFVDRPNASIPTALPQHV